MFKLKHKHINLAGAPNARAGLLLENYALRADALVMVAEALIDSTSDKKTKLLYIEQAVTGRESAISYRKLAAIFWN